MPPCPLRSMLTCNISRAQGHSMYIAQHCMVWEGDGLTSKVAANVPWACGCVHWQYKCHQPNQLYIFSSRRIVIPCVQCDAVQRAHMRPTCLRLPFRALALYTRNADFQARTQSVSCSDEGCALSRGCMYKLNSSAARAIKSRKDKLQSDQGPA